MPEKYPYGKRNKYPHMMPADVAIWERFIEQNPDIYDEVSYDVKVGNDPQFDTTVSPETGGNATDLYKLKIDVVGYKAGKLDIIEIGPNAGAGKVGQVKRYRYFYVKEFNPSQTPRACVLTDKTDLNTQEFADIEGITILVA